MSALRLKSLMEAEDKRLIDIASELRISTTTVSKYLRGDRINRANKCLIETYLKSKEAQQSGGQTAAG